MNPKTTRENRLKVIQIFYRNAVKKELLLLMKTWSQKMDVTLPTWQIRRMRTMWGSCNSQANRILINTELAKKTNGMFRIHCGT